MVSVSGRDDGMRNETVANVALFRERERSSLVGARRPVVPLHIHNSRCNHAQFIKLLYKKSRNIYLQLYTLIQHGAVC